MTKTTKTEIQKVLTKDWQSTQQIYSRLIKKTKEYSMQRLGNTLNSMYKFKEIDKIKKVKGKYECVWRLR